MVGIYTRYPGAQPFADDDLSRKVFFGREQESLAVTNQILVNRMVVVYAKSGLGKSSLLNAGVAQRLRDEGYLPLIVRVNDTKHGPFVSILEGIRTAAEHQKIEYVPGRSESLWTFFKTVEFWRGDLLLTPVLILDQFEELFTLQEADRRAAFIADMGYLIRGVPPPSATATEELSETAPVVRIVLSLREDYLGFLDEAADRIPQILDHRFRLMPLSVEAAAEAIIGPARINDPTLQTKPFEYDSGTVGTILDYLSRRRTQAAAEKATFVEPFHLQLICQRVEEIAAQRQHGSQPTLSITVNDIGGDVALKRILEHFYIHAVGALSKRHVRRAVRQLCEDYLISPEGRRLSIEEYEIHRQLNIPVEILKQLVNSRLLRSDSRSDSTYYELSHDALVVPVLDTRRAKATAAGWLSLITGSFVFILAAFLVAFLVFLFTVVVNLYETPPTWMQPQETWEILRQKQITFFDYVMLSGLLALLLYGASLVRRGLRRIRRYHIVTHLLIQPKPTARRVIDRTLGWLGLISVLISLIVTMIFCIAVFVIIISPLYYDTMSGLVTGINQAWWQSVRANGILLDSIAIIATLPVLFLFNAESFAWSIRKFIDHKHYLPNEIAASLSGRRPMAALALGSAWLIVLMVIILAAAYWAFSILLVIDCTYYSEGTLPNLLSERWFNGFLDMAEKCQSSFEKRFKWFDIMLSFIFVMILSVYGTRFLRRGIRTMRRYWRRASPISASG